MRRIAFFLGCLAMVIETAPVWAAPCRNPQALGISRTITITPAEYPKVGSVHYSASQQLPLREREVVLTFDDGPLMPYTDQVLDALAKECVKATFFVVGRQATTNAALLRRVYNEGHTIGTHSQNHPLTFDQMPLDAAQREIDDGIASASAALGNPNAVAPFFRIPGFLRIAAVEDYLTSRGITVWSTDVDADDWYKTAAPEDIVKKAMSRLADKRNQGIILLHDVHPATALALPMLLTELKAKGFKVVQVVPAGKRSALNEKPAAPAPATITGWPRVAPPKQERPQRLRWHSRPPPDWIY